MNYELGINFIVTYYNEHKYLDASIDSILNSINEFKKTYGSQLKCEIVISDDNSKEKQTTNVLERQKDKSKFITIIRRSENIGVSKNRNLAISECKNRYKYIFVLDSDDKIDENYIPELWNYILNDYDLIYSDDLILDNKGNPVGYNYRTNIYDIEFLKNPFTKANIPSCILLKREKFEEIGGYDETNKLTNGSEFYLPESIDLVLTLIAYYSTDLKWFKINKPHYIKTNFKNTKDRLTGKVLSFPNKSFSNIYLYKKHHKIWNEKILKKYNFKLQKPPLYDKYECLFEEPKTYKKIGF